MSSNLRRTHRQAIVLGERMEAAAALLLKLAQKNHTIYKCRQLQQPQHAQRQRRQRQRQQQQRQQVNNATAFVCMYINKPANKAKRAHKAKNNTVDNGAKQAKTWLPRSSPLPRSLTLPRSPTPPRLPTLPRSPALPCSPTLLLSEIYVV